MAMWNRRAETLSGAELDKVRDSRLAKTLRRAWTSERYRAILAKGGVSSVDGVSSIADIVRLPFVTADDLVSPDSPFPLLCVGYRDILEVHRGSGKQFATPYTKGDLLVWAECVARAFSAAGASQGDRASMPDGEGFFTGDSFGFYHGARKAGICSVPHGEGALSVVYECSHSAIRNVRTGESIALLGIPETGGIGTIGCECSRHDGFHVWEDCIYPEIIDGELVVTTLCLEAQPLVRYRTGLKARFVSREKCPCGRTSPRIEILGDALG